VERQAIPPARLTVHRREPGRRAVEIGAPELGTAREQREVWRLTKMERALQGAEWLAGKRLTMADVAIPPYVNRLARRRRATRLDPSRLAANWDPRYAGAYRIVTDTIHRCIPRSRLVVIRGGGHLAPTEHGSAFNEVLLSFLTTR
jgi:glutathione S-transferase